MRPADPNAIAATIAMVRLRERVRELENLVREYEPKARAFDSMSLESTRRLREAIAWIDDVLRYGQNLNLSAGMSSKDLEQWAKYRGKTAPKQLRALRKILFGDKKK